MANKKYNNKIKREIKYVLITYLENRFNIGTSLLTENLKDNKESLEDYVRELKNANKILADLRDDDTRSREKAEYEETVNLHRVKLINEISYQVVPTKDNIKEILELVRYFLDNYPLPTSESFNETLLLRHVMRKLSHDKWVVIREKAFKYYAYFNSNKDSCFRENISGRISFGYGNLILIVNQDGKVLFRVDENNRVVNSYCPFDDYILFGDQIVLAKFDNSLVPLREVDGYYHDFLTTGRLYQNVDPDRDNYIEICYCLKDYLEGSGLDDYYKKVLSLKEMDIINRLINKNTDSIKARIISSKQNNGN